MDLLLSSRLDQNALWHTGREYSSININANPLHWVLETKRPKGKFS